MKPRQPAPEKGGKVLIPEDENLLDLRRAGDFFVEKEKKT